MPLSGRSWVDLFPTSTSLDDLDPTFKAKVRAFADALVAAGADIEITASRRPRERAYLMHYAWAIWKHREDPKSIPAFKPRGGEAAVDIQWLHTTATGAPDIGASRDAAAEMVAGYQMLKLGTPPALNSNHIAGKALDMVVTWDGDLAVDDKDGKVHTITSTPRDSTNADLIKVGKTYGVIHFVNVLKDRPHWSVDGH
jgi:hypothetical protein